MKPMTMAFEARASETSFSVIPPTPRWMTWIRTSSCGNFSRASTIASSDPWTSALITRFNTGSSPSRARTSRSAKLDAGLVATRSAARCLLSRFCESLAVAGLCIPSALPGHINAPSFHYQ